MTNGSDQGAVFRCSKCEISWHCEGHAEDIAYDACPRCGSYSANERYRPPPDLSAPYPDVVAVVVLTSAATTTALAYLQALVQEAAKDTYQFLKHRLRPGDALPDKGIDHGARDVAPGVLRRLRAGRADDRSGGVMNPDSVRLIDDTNRVTIDLPAHIPAEAYMAVPSLDIRPVQGVWIAIAWHSGTWNHRPETGA